MALEQKPFEEMTTMMGKSAEKTMEQGQEAIENYFSWMQKSMSGSQWADNEMTKKLMSNMERNVATTQAYVQKISQARDIQDFMKIQTYYIQEQMATFAEQTKEFGEIFMKTMTEGMKTPLSH